MTLAIWLGLALLDGATNDWPRFRGPNGSGLSAARNLPSEFGKSNLAWKVEVPGGTSSPIVVGGRAYLSGFEKDDRLVMALDLKTGGLLWKRALAKERTEAANPLNGPATPTPVSDGKDVYVFFPEIGLVSYDRAGKLRWKTSLGSFHSVQGLAASPVVVDGMVVLLIDQTRDSYAAAFDAKSGKQRWKAERGGTVLGGYSTPVVYRPRQGPAQVIVFGATETTGYQAATGEKLWWANGLALGPASSPSVVGGTLFASEPAGTDMETPYSVFLGMDKNKDGKIERSEIAGDGMMRLLMGVDASNGNNDGVFEELEWRAFEASGKARGGLVALELGGRGDITKSAIRWRAMKSIPYLTSSLIYDGVVYLIRDGGILASYDAGTGKVIKEARLEGAIDKYYAQPVAGDGKLYLVSENGKLSTVKAGGEWERLSVHDLEEPAYATPALTDGRVIVRTRKALYCFGQ